MTSVGGPPSAVRRRLKLAFQLALVCLLAIAVPLGFAALPAFGTTHIHGLTDKEVANMMVSLDKPPRLALAQLADEDGMPPDVQAIVFPEGQPVFGKDEAVAFAVSGDPQPQDVLDAQLVLATSNGPLNGICDSSPRCPPVGRSRLYWLIVTKRHVPQGTIGDRAVTFVNPYARGTFRMLLPRDAPPE
jgi:hypothetical protein